MIKLRKKLSSALLFSIAIHVIIFSILYINFRETDTIKNIDIFEQKSTAYKTGNEQLSTKIISEDNLEVDSIKKTAEDEQKLLLQTDDLKSLDDKDERESLGKDTLETYTVTKEIIVSDKNSKPFLQDKGALDYGKDPTPIDTINDPVLTSIDVPGQVRGNSETREIENSLVSEVEEVNAQLSAAINEVKERNQKKIDQQRQQQTYTRVSEEWFLVIDLLYTIVLQINKNY